MATKTDIRKIVEQGKATIGTQKTIKEIKKGTVAKVFMTANCPEGIKSLVSKLQKTGKFEVEQLHETNEELGIVCKKPFKISVLSTKKEK